MAFQSVPNAASAAIHFDLGGKDMVNVLNFQFASAYSQTNIDALAFDVDSWVAADYLPVVASAVTYIQTVVRGLTSIIDLSSVNNTGTGPGGVATACLPANASACITLRTGHTGRSARGRFFAVPTGASNQLTGQSFVHSYMVYLATHLLTLQTNAAASGWIMSIVSRRTGGALRPVGTTLPITQFSPRNDLIDSQRGRLEPNH